MNAQETALFEACLPPYTYYTLRCKGCGQIRDFDRRKEPGPGYCPCKREKAWTIIKVWGKHNQAERTEDKGRGNACPGLAHPPSGKRGL